MPPAYLFFLPIAFGAFWLNLRAREELICIITAISGSFFLILGLMLAPWFIQLLMLIFLCRPESLLINLFFKRKH
ncbi:MAG: hypothetical protein MH252_05030 [Thermosynechococcaceae cyanobacterium MS004]|nr:hypothetical protein [Thermosynechococcaceae cyanobacterium MS004]